MQSLPNFNLTYPQYKFIILFLIILLGHMEMQMEVENQIQKWIEQEKLQKSNSQDKQWQAEYDYELANYRFGFKEQKETWLKHLQDNGFVVIKQFIEKEKCESYVEELWKMMEYLSPTGKLNKNDIQTQKIKENYPPLLHGGMIQYIGHSKVQWKLRQQTKPIFQCIWQEKDLKSSFDGLCFMNGQLNYQKRPENLNLHVDQSPLRKKLWSYQGIMTLTDADENGGGFICVPKSHKFHQQYFKSIKKQSHKADWFKIPEQDKYKEPICNYIKLNTKAGDFILFDSRTFHCNTCPMTKTLRVCIYVCMLPSKKVTERVKQLRRLAYKNRRTSSHHPGDGFRTFPLMPPRKLANPQALQKKIDEINNQIVLNQEASKLI